MFATNGKWIQFKSKQEFDQHVKNDESRVKHDDWIVPGWYYCYHTKQRCPRGCCYDDVAHYQYVNDRIQEIKDDMKESIDYLKEARLKQGGYMF